MILSRKGLSDIVTNVLIILLVLVAISIIWAFVRPTINQGAGQLEGQGECLTVDVSAVSCDQRDNNDYTVTYRRGSDDADIQAIKLIFKDAAGNSRVVELTGTGDIPGALESRTKLTIDPDGTDGGGVDYDTVDTAVVVRISNNPAGRTCEARTAPVACT